MTMAVELVELADVQLHPENPKGHDEAEIRDSFVRLGFIDPVVIDGRTGLLIAGHGRTKTLRQMKDNGEPPPPGVATDDDGSWLVPAVTGWSSANDREARAALVALNRTTETGGWHHAELLVLLNDLEANDPGLTGTGYDDGSLDDLRNLLAAHDELDELADAYEPPDDSVGGVTISLTDEEVASRWLVHSREWDNADTAMRVLLDLL